MAEFRASHSDFERMLHLRARTFAPVTPKAHKPLIRLVNSRNGRETPLPQHSRPGRRFRDGPWQHRNRSREGVNWSDNPAMEDRPKQPEPDQRRPTFTLRCLNFGMPRRAGGPLGGAVPSKTCLQIPRSESWVSRTTSSLRCSG